MRLNSKLMTRRKAIKGAVALIGGSIATSQLGTLISSVAAMDGDSEPLFLTSEHFSMVEQIADLIIPETDTPGAKRAGAHRFIDYMLAEWASPETQSKYVAGLNAIDQRSAEFNGSNFLENPLERQIALLESLDAESYTDGGEDSFFRNLKSFVLFGYYSSEEGASVELRFDRLPGPYEDCVSVDENARSWST